MIHTKDLRDARILVTGASGCIGGRLVDYLTLGCGAQVRTLIRSHGRAVHVARLPVELIPGDLMDKASLQKAVEGCDLVIHCAFGSDGDEQAQRNVTVTGTVNLLKAAAEARVRRFVHISTIAVHGPDPGPWIDERTPVIHSDNGYADAKADAEVLVNVLAQNLRLPTVVLRPTIVYGPRSISWTVGPINRLKKGKFALIENGVGLANPVHVDDVIQAILLASTRPEAVGETFVVSAGTTVTWREFFSYYARWMNVDLPNLTVAAIDEQRRWLADLGKPVGMGLTFLASSHAQSVISNMPGVGGVATLAVRGVPKGLRQAIMSRAATLRDTKLNPPSLPSPWTVELFLARGVCSIDKTRRTLGFEPQITLEQGMRNTEDWLRDTRLIAA